MKGKKMKKNKKILKEDIDKEDARDILNDVDMESAEFEELVEEIDHFKKEKERVRAIVGNIGSMPTFNSKLFNYIFAFIVIGLLIISFFVKGERLHFLLSDLAIAAISAKIIYLIHNQARVNHFKLWILSSLEWKVNEISKKVKNIEKEKEEEK